jgi:threonine-phosphate decarboxylase
MKAEGIAIRSCANYHGLGEGWYRVAVRLPEENEQLIAALREAAGR